MYLSAGKCNDGRYKVPSRTPHHQGITGAREHKASQHLARVGVVVGETHAMQQHKEHERDDRKTFNDAAKVRLRVCFVTEQYKVDRCRFKERHQLWTNTFQLKIQICLSHVVNKHKHIIYKRILWS